MPVIIFLEVFGLLPAPGSIIQNPGYVNLNIIIKNSISGLCNIFFLLSSTYSGLRNEKLIPNDVCNYQWPFKIKVHNTSLICSKYKMY